MQILWAHLQDEPPDPAAEREDVSADLGWAILRALEKEPESRPPSATAYARMVRFAANPSASARPGAMPVSELVLTHEPSGSESRIGSETTIGREGCDLVLADAEVSRRHAVVRVNESGYSVEDLGSTNGTFVNERGISGPTALSDGDRLQVGETVFVVKLAAADATRLRATPPPPRQPTPRRPRARAAHSEPPPPTRAAAARTEPAAARARRRPRPPPPHGRRPGDVPRPDDEPPSVIRRAIPAGQATLEVHALRSPPARRRGPSAARRLEATVVCYARGGGDRHRGDLLLHPAFRR